MPSDVTPAKWPTIAASRLELQNSRKPMSETVPPKAAIVRTCAVGRRITHRDGDMDTKSAERIANCVRLADTSAATPPPMAATDRPTARKPTAYETDSATAIARKS